MHTVKYPVAYITTVQLLVVLNAPITYIAVGVHVKNYR